MAPALSATTYTWDGGGSNNQTTTAANWSPNIAPPHNGVPGSNDADWVFAGSVNRSVLLTQPARVRSLSFNSASSFSIVGGGLLTLNDSFRNDGSASQTFSNDIRLNGNVRIEANAGDLTIVGDINTSARDLTLVAETGQLTLDGLLSGSSISGIGIVKTGSGVLKLDPPLPQGTNTYSSLLTIAEGDLLLSVPGALSTNANAKLIVDRDASVIVRSTTLSNHPVELSGTLEMGNSSRWNFTDGLSIIGDNAEITSSSSSFSQNLTSSSPVVLTGKKLVLSASDGQTLDFGIDLEVDPPSRTGADIFINKSDSAPTATVEISGAITKQVGSGGVLFGLTVLGGELILDEADLSDFQKEFTIESSARLSLPINKSQSINNLSGGGDISLGITSSGGLTVNSTIDTVYTGVIEGGANTSFVKTGPKTLSITRDLSAGAIQINEGNLEMQGGRLMESGSTTLDENSVSSGGILSGSGEFNLNTFGLSDGGILRPGINGSGGTIIQDLWLRTGGIIEWSPASWTGDAISGWPQFYLAGEITLPSVSSTEIRINTDLVSDFVAGDAEFQLASDGYTINGFNAGKFDVVDTSMNPLPGTWSIALSRNTPTVKAGLSLIFTADERPDPYRAWIESFGYTGPDSEPTADPDLDGLDNGIEFIVGSSPADLNEAELPILSVVEEAGVTYQRFAFRQAKDAAYLNPTGQVSADLVVWNDLDTAAGYFLRTTPIDPDTDWVEQFIIYDTTASPKRFLQLFVDFSD